MNLIPKLSQITTSQDKNHRLHIFTGLLVGALFITLFYFSSDFGIKSLYIGIAGAVMTTFGMYAMEHEEHMQSSYRASLKNYELDELIKLSNSKELNDTERGLVVQYLNDNHSGWSISKSNPV